MFTYMTAVNGGVFDYDARRYDYDWDPIENLVNDFLNEAIDEFYEALHIN